MKSQSARGIASPPTRAARIPIGILALCAMWSANARAFNSSLQPEEVREAYYLGQTSNHKDLADFLNQYERDFKYPSDNPVAYVQTIEFQTPYEQIVLRSMRTTQYSKFQADEDYGANPGLVILRVVVALKLNYTGPMPAADSFKVVVTQANQIEPRDIATSVTCDPYNPNIYPVTSECSVYTREIVLQFDAAQFAPGRASVRVMLPFGPSMETKYNLDKLK